MLVKLRRQEFDSLNDTALGRACFEPFIPMIRGKDNTVKTQVYKQLTTGQQALFMFNAYFNHASNSLAEFYWWSAYYLAQPKAWSEIKAGMRYFRADAMLEVLEKMEGILKERNDSNRLDMFDASYNDLDNDSELLEWVSSLNTIFHECSPAILKGIGQYIRSHPHEFLQFES